MFEEIKNMDKQDKLNKLLDWLEENIDLDHVMKIEQLHLDTLDYKKTSFLPLSIIYPTDKSLRLYPYIQAFTDPEKMLYNELISSFSSIVNSVKLKDFFPLHIRSNHGIGILASMFGANVTIMGDSMPWVESLKSEMSIKEAAENGVPDFKSGLGEKVIGTCQYYREKLSGYPKCREAIRISQPDLQGPFDIAHLLIGTEIYYMLYDRSRTVHKLLNAITETYIAFRKHIEGLLTDSAGEDAVYVHGSIYKGKVIIKDDTAAVNLSKDMYEEFSKQYNERILTAFGGGAIHYCGQERPWHFDSINGKYLKAINYGNPELHDISSSYEYWSRYKIPIIWYGYNQNPEFLDKIYEADIPTGMSLAIKAGSFEQAKSILETHIN